MLLRKLFAHIFIVGLINCIYSQNPGLNNVGSSIIITSGANLILSGSDANYTNLSDGAVNGNLFLNGNFQLEGNWNNNAGSDYAIDPVATGKVIFNGTSNQVIKGTNTYFADLEVNNPSGIRFQQSSNVRQNVNFINGKIYLSNCDLMINTFSGENSSNYFISEGSGRLISYVSNSPKLFPVGTTTSYLPISITNSRDADEIAVKVFNKVTDTGSPDGNAFSHLNHAINATWQIGQTNPASNSLTIIPQWSLTDENPEFNRNLSSVYYNRGTDWEKIDAPMPASGSNPYTQTGTNAAGSHLTPLYVTIADNLFLIDQLTVNLPSGYILVGLPLNTEERRYWLLYQNAIMGTFLESQNNVYVAATEFEIGKGYWLRFSAPETVTFQGTKIKSVNLNLPLGWSIIAGPSCTVPVGNIVDNDQIIIPGTIYGWNNGYVTTTTIEPGKGYWIRTSKAGTISMTCSNNKDLKIPEILPDVSDFSGIQIRDKSGSMQKLFFNSKLGNPGVAVQFSLPPKMPFSNFDVRFTNDSRLTETDEAEIIIQSNGFPLEVTFNNLQNKFIGESRSKNSYILAEISENKVVNSRIINDGEKYLIKNPSVNILKIYRLNSTGLPDMNTNNIDISEIAPNPFRTSTQFYFSHNSHENLDVSVYNLFGKKIKSLVPLRQSQGLSHVEWNRSSDAGPTVNAGTYLIVIQSGAQRIVKKVIVID